jgi:hypothetical protein
MRGGSAVLAAAAALLTAGAGGAAETGSLARREPPAMDLHITQQPAAALATRAFKGAARRLESPRCRGLFAQMKARDGRPLQETLDGLGTDPAAYLGLLRFADGQDKGRCASPYVLATTRTNLRLVWICPRQFERAALASPEVAEATLIHEVLHTLGLGENPPSSQEITARVMRECRK